MKRPLGTLLIALTAFGAPTFTVPRLAAAAPSNAQSPEELYDQGRKAYRVGDFERSVEKWEAAYAASDNALLLYNISLAYRGRYTITNDIADLRRARAVLDNFIKVAEADPDIDVDDAPEKLEELDRQIEEADARENENQPVLTPPPVTDTKQPESTPDPGRAMRLGGIGTMAGGGALVLGGAAGAIFLFVQAQRFSDDLARESQIFETECSTSDETERCEGLQRRVDYFRDNGKKADDTAILLLAIGGGVGVLALVAGGLVYNEGNKRTKLWEKSRFQSVRVVPTRTGISVSGRF